MNWAHYILQVNIYLIVFYGFYKLLLDKETYFTLNRLYLISAGILSLVIPFLRFEWFTTQSAAQPVYAGVDQLSTLITQVSFVHEAPDGFAFGNLLVLLYITGAFIFTVKLILQLFSVRKLLKNNIKGSAFSFLNKKIIDSELPQLHTIHKHEEIHIKQMHTLDVLFFEILGILTWFNPVIYLYKYAIRNIHEFLADEEAARFQGDKKQYALLLLSSAFGITPGNLTNNFFNKSLIKKRIFMLHKERSRKAAVLKYGLFVPLFALTLVLSSATIRNNEEILAITDNIPLEQPLKTVKEVVSQAVDLSKDRLGIVKKALSNTTEVPGLNRSGARVSEDWKPFYNFLMKSIKYPATAQEAGLQGTSTIKFTLKSGAVENLGTASNALGKGLEAEVMRVILAYKDFKSMPDGKYLLPVSFSIQGKDSKVQKKAVVRPEGYTLLSEVVIRGYQRKNETAVPGLRGSVSIRELGTTDSKPEDQVHNFSSIDQQPNYPGGLESFYTYVANSIKYPQEAKDKQVQGKVYLSFIVETDGSLTDIQVLRRLGGGLDEEAIRVLKESKKWKPGLKDGKPVRVKFTIPISFSLANPDIKIKMKDSTNHKIDIDVLTGKVVPAIPPLYIIDGKKVKNISIKDIPQKDILSIEVLMDSTATALYGDEARHGVVLVKTIAGEKKQLPKAKKN